MTADAGGARALDGIRVVWLAAPGPLPFATMLLADLGADVVRVDRTAAPPELTGLGWGDDPRSRGQRAIGLDLKQAAARDVLRRLTDRADVFLEGMRPGAAERLGIGPAELGSGNPGLVYVRMTGWGQDGPLAARAGHDINYLAVAGALYPLGPADAPPTVPLNLVADFGGGGTYAALGVLAALMQRAATGRGQVIDCAMVDGVASLTTLFHGMRARGLWSDERGANLLDGSAPYYRTYVTADGGFMAVGAMEPQFYAELLRGLGLDAADWPQHDRANWPAQIAAMEGVFAAQPRSHWENVFGGTDACVTPVLSLGEASAGAPLAERGTFVEWEGLRQPAPAPRLSASPSRSAPRASRCGHTDEILRELGIDSQAAAKLRAASAVA